MGPVETAGAAEGSSSRHPSVSICRPRLKRLLFLVVAVLVFGQLSMNMLFYRNSDSLFYVNTTSTAAAAGPLLLDSQVSSGLCVCVCACVSPQKLSVVHFPVLFCKFI